MKKYFLLFAFLLSTSSSHAFEWSVNEYIKNCSVVHQKRIAAEDKEILGYCMGVLKGTLAGILATKSLESDDIKVPSCLLANGHISNIEIQKKVLAILRLKHTNHISSDKPNTANAAVAFSLFELYPCLLKE
jgi:hypothetical protein